MGGYTQLLGDPGQAPLSLPGHYLEFQTGQYAFIAANTCRLAREAATVDIGMLETLLSLSQHTIVQWHCLGEIRRRHGNDLWATCPANLYRLRDGYLYVNIAPDFWDAFSLFLDRPELVLDARFETNAQRMAHRAELHAIVAAALADLDRAEVDRRAAELRIPAGVVLTLDEVLHDPHLAARNFWQLATAADGSRARTPALPWRFDNPPRLALDTPEIRHG
jgi:crotonobetainyl-CoA:carnitine CoA-transferase CaiB-like acyl-CoA transferase